MLLIERLEQSDGKGRFKRLFGAEIIAKFGSNNLFKLGFDRIVLSTYDQVSRKFSF